MALKTESSQTQTLCLEYTKKEQKAMLYFLAFSLTVAAGLYLFIHALDKRAEERSKDDETLYAAYPWKKIWVLALVAVFFVATFTTLSVTGKFVGNLISLILGGLGLFALLVGIYHVEDELQGNALTALSIPLVTVLAVSITYLIPALRAWPYFIGIALVVAIHCWNKYLTESAANS